MNTSAMWARWRGILCHHYCSRIPGSGRVLLPVSNICGWVVEVGSTPRHHWTQHGWPHLSIAGDNCTMFGPLWTSKGWWAAVWETHCDGSELLQEHLIVCTVCQCVRGTDVWCWILPVVQNGIFLLLQDHDQSPVDQNLNPRIFIYSITLLFVHLPDFSYYTWSGSGKLPKHHKNPKKSAGLRWNWVCLLQFTVMLTNCWDFAEASRWAEDSCSWSQALGQYLHKVLFELQVVGQLQCYTVMSLFLVYL